MNNREGLFDRSARRREEQKASQRQAAAGAAVFRIAAALVDIAAVMVPVMLLSEVLGRMGVSWGLWPWILLWVVLFQLRDLPGGRSVGKRLAGLRVEYIRKGEERVKPADLLKRCCIDFLFPLALWQLATGREKTGDRLARTRVTAEGASFGRRAATVVCALLCVVLCWAGFGYMGAAAFARSEVWPVVTEYVEAKGYADADSEYRIHAAMTVGDTGSCSITVDGAEITLMLRRENGRWTAHEDKMLTGYWPGSDPGWKVE